MTLIWSLITSAMVETETLSVLEFAQSEIAFKDVLMQMHGIDHASLDYSGSLSRSHISCSSTSWLGTENCSRYLPVISWEE